MRVFWAAVVLAAGCVSSAKFQPAHRNSGQSAPVLYRAAVRVLAEQGFELGETDADAGLVVTAWKDADQVLLTKRQLRWRVTVDDGVVTVQSDCQAGSDDPDQGWSKCGDQTEGRSEEAARLADAIVRAAR